MRDTGVMGGEGESSIYMYIYIYTLTHPAGGEGGRHPGLPTRFPSFLPYGRASGGAAKDFPVVEPPQRSITL